MRMDNDQQMFGLSAAERDGRILVCGDASVEMNAELQSLTHCMHHAMPTSGERLPFTDFDFDIALCLHALFVDATVNDIDAHVQIIKELARVAKDVRIFPLTDSSGLPSALLGPVLLVLNQENYGVEVRDVMSSLKPAGNAMLHVWAQQCQVG